MRYLSLLVIAWSLSFALPARADENEAAAQLLYEEAKTDMDAGNHADACPKLEKSVAIEEAMGARFLLAECYEKIGKLASAWNNYVRVADQAHKEGLADREEYARNRAKETRALVPTVTLALAPGTRELDLEVLRNGESVSSALVDAPIPLDPGVHDFEIRAPGHAPFAGSVTVTADSGNQTLAVPMLEELAEVPADLDAPAPVTRPDDPAAEEGGVNAMLIAGLVVGGVGLAAIGASIGIGASAKSSYDSAVDEHCDEAGCNPDGVTDTEDARSTGTIGTVVFGVGAGVAAVGVVLTILGLTSGDEREDGVALHVAPSLTTPGGVLHLQGSF